MQRRNPANVAADRSWSGVVVPNQVWFAYRKNDRYHQRLQVLLKLIKD